MLGGIQLRQGLRQRRVQRLMHGRVPRTPLHQEDRARIHLHQVQNALEGNGQDLLERQRFRSHAVDRIQSRKTVGLALHGGGKRPAPIRHLQPHRIKFPEQFCRFIAPRDADRRHQVAGRHLARGAQEHPDRSEDHLLGHPGRDDRDRKDDRPEIDELPAQGGQKPVHFLFRGFDHHRPGRMVKRGQHRDDVVLGFGLGFVQAGDPGFLLQEVRLQHRVKLDRQNGEVVFAVQHEAVPAGIDDQRPAAGLLAQDPGKLPERKRL